MECPKCHQITNTDETGNKYFVGRNSDGIPFFKCEECGNLFYVNEMDETTHSISRGKKIIVMFLLLLGFLLGLSLAEFSGFLVVTQLLG